jgi:hypothetical protein
MSHRAPAAAGVLVLLLLLVGCSGTSAGPAAATATATGRSATQAPTVRPTSAGSPSMPAAFLGTWNTDRAQCGQQSQGSEGSLTVKPRHLQFYEGGGPVAVVVRQGEVVTVTLTLSSEGSTEEATYRFALSADGQTLTDLSTGGVRYRCR